MRTLVEYEEDAAKAVSHSHMLWLHVNRVIHKVIETAIAQHKSRQWVHDRLMKIAGPKEKGEPISLCNFRSAATQILLGEGELVLL